MLTFDKRPSSVWFYRNKHSLSYKHSFSFGLEHAIKNLQLNVDCGIEIGLSSFPKRKKNKKGNSWIRKGRYIKDNRIDTVFRKMENEVSGLVIKSCGESKNYINFRIFGR
jgi:hypothetical protein